MSDDGEDLSWENELSPDRKRIGYRNPPHHNRFRKGRSGNPKGRPKRHVATESIEY